MRRTSFIALVALSLGVVGYAVAVSGSAATDARVALCPGPL